MPFERLETQPHQVHAGRPSISYKRPSSKKTGPRPPRLMIGIPGALMPPKGKVAERYGLSFGSGKDAGRLRIVPDAKGIEPGKRMNFLTFSFGFVPMLGDEAAEKEFIDGKLLEGGAGWELTLPAWFKPPVGA